jgi:hypothetical protein
MKEESVEWSLDEVEEILQWGLAVDWPKLIELSISDCMVFSDTKCLEFFSHISVNSFDTE